MKVRARPAVWQAVRQRVIRWSGHPVVEAAGKCLGAAAVSFLLSGVSVGDSFLPLSVSLTAALGLGLPAFGAYLGGCVGYGVFFGLDAAMEPMAAGLLVVACLCIFGDQIAADNRWFAPTCAALFTAIIGLLFLLQSRFLPKYLWRYLLRVGAAALGADCFRSANRTQRLLLPVCLCAGLCSVRPFGFPVGLIAGCAVAASAAGSSMALTAAVFCGLALDLCWAGGSCTAVLTLAALACRRSEPWYLRLLLWYAPTVLGILLTGTDPLLLAAAMAGAFLSLAIPTDRLFARPLPPRQNDPRLALAAGLLEQLSRCMSLTRADKPDPETNTVFDRAADRVCRMCSLWETCWETELQETCDTLNRAAPAMMTRGKALREDFPATFTGRCRHWEGFLTAVNRELDDLACRRQYRSRIRESRAVLAQQYGVLSKALAKSGPEEAEAFRFRPELGFRSRGRHSDTPSGDRGASFRVGKWFYLLLCDGMGTGTAASAEAGAAIGILRTLLQSGIDPEDALCLLNGIYILRDDGGFATVDLLQTDLVTGEGRLYKWGGAPSYLKRKGEVEKIGTAAPPPGLGVGEDHHPEGARLSLSRGEMLVLVSDGAGGEAAERFIGQYGGLSPKELASGIVSCAAPQDEDDRTAAVLTLRPRLSV